MFSKSLLVFVSLALHGLARERWLERDGHAVLLHPRRFGQEHPAMIDKLSAACPGEVCGVLAGQAITPLLAAQGECTQQDMADAIIDAAQQFDDATKANMIALAVEYRQVEKNTPPDFSVQPNILRNSVFCQKAPKHAELNGLVQAQDPANDPNSFFDPASPQATVKKGSQSNTFPFGTAGSASSNTTSSAVASASSSSAIAAATSAANVDIASSTSSAAAASSTASSSSAIGDFGSCSVPQIEFATGFDNRKETSFQPVDKTSYNHGSAQNIDIITQFICDTLTNTCGADQTAKDTCQQARAAADTVTAKTGGQADAFNAVFGITTDFAAVAEVDNQGNVVAGTGSSAASSAAADTTTTTTTSAADATATDCPGDCTVPQIEFATGFDNRKETSFQPVDKTSYDHGSAQNIDIITHQTAKDTCAKAKAAADTVTAKTGGQADAFNAVFGITTDFAAVASVDDQGNVIAGTGSSAASSASSSASASSITSSAAASSTSAASAGGNLQTFTGALGGVTAPAVTANADGSFQVDGNASFKDEQNALVRSCDVQHNQCANAANASGNKGALTVAACGDQQTQCNAAATTA
ncbi:hypothetical protein PUNSTDRAFT_75322 [Punctularia strigosozonata HHB-11173 SS5]|uniref:Uncharacterized protein n=1 Tax=Punctularia strigosozonata (strain HHB-11173) TaxID=741275 RepID=R7S4W3_PUNST|nr:uncharacterized protein PUNSTDRAFT_75322 [Punctularia strigosozonata HHB-11173 SS5]EIN04862.1 hypothetical protein PUNSTDRAFT_75322 [Punctularia strigosozonata HHB-11173 SS5]